MHKKAMLLLGLMCISLKSFAVLDPWSFPNYIQDFNTQINTMITAQRELISIQNQVKNLNTVSDYQWENVEQLMNQMSGAMEQGQALSYQMSDADQQFRQRYPDYTNSGTGYTNYSKAYQQWNTTTLDTLRGSLSTTSIDASQIKNEEQILDHLKQQGSSATGRMQALQVSTEIAGENVDQLLQLKGLMMTQMNAQNAYMAYQVSKDSYSEEALEALVSHADTQFPNYKDNTHLGKISF